LHTDTLFPDDACIHRFEYYDREQNISLGGQTKIIVVELSKVAEKPAESMTSAERWFAFFRYCAVPEQRDLVNELLEYEEGIVMAGEVLITVTKDEIEWARRESEYKYEVDLQSKMVRAKREGSRQTKLDIARKMKGLGMAPDQIAIAASLMKKSRTSLSDTPPRPLSPAHSRRPPVRGGLPGRR
jgi:hypothetical protein